MHPSSAIAAPPAARQRGSDFSVLARRVKDAGLLERHFRGYAVRISATVAFYTAGWVWVWLLGNSWWQLAAAVVLGLAFTQIGFLGHDGGHQQMTPSKRVNSVLAYLAGDLLIGLSLGWWLDKHNRHHANPNKEDHDPDIGDGVLAFTTTQVAKRTGGFGRWLVGRQAWLFFPLMTLEGLSLHVAGTIWLCRNLRSPTRRVELAVMVTHLAGYTAGLLAVMSPLHALAFAAVQQAVFGVYLGCSFAPNHKGMNIIGANEKLDFLRRQVLTSRNVRGGWFTDLLLGGLNYQVEHHLFPSMPRSSLRRAQQLVRAYCQQLSVPYVEVSLIASYWIAIRHLHDIGAPARAAR